MNGKQEKNPNKKKLFPTLIIIIIIIMVIAACYGLITLMRNSVNSSVYTERRELLGRLTQAGADVIEDNINYGVAMAEVFSKEAQHSLEESEGLDSFFERENKIASYSDMIFFLVDANGKYYSSDGVYGKLVDSEYYTSSSEDTVSYISSLPHLDAEKSYLIIRNRFSETVSVKTEYGTSDIIYSGILYDIDNVTETVSEEFSGDNNVFLYDDTTGVMLYKNFGIKLLINGFNIYSKIYNCNLLYNTVGEDIEKACRDGEIAVCAFSLDGEEFYFCSAPVNVKDWSFAVIVQSKYLDSVSGNAFNSIIFYITMIALLLAIVLIVVVVLFYRSSAKSKSIKEITLLNDELDRATKAKSDFLSNMSHDIRTPINGIMGMTTIAKGVEGNPEKTTECLNKIEGASHHLLSLVNDVLDMSRIERGKTEIAKEPIDIISVCNNCSNIINGQLNGRELELISEFDCEHRYLIGDDLHLRQIFINILGNAVKFTKDGGRINFRLKEVETTDSTATIAFEFEDNGIGMNSEFLTKIFDAFTQDDGGARSQYKGTGLGMAITKQLTELMGGTIEVESELGVGSKFTVTIPFEIDREERSHQEEENETIDLTGVKILLVEDNDLNMEIATELLEDEGAVITQAEDGQIAYNKFKDNAPGTFDVILMDVNMPNMNGIEATKAIRVLEREDAKTIPIIAMTANAFQSDIQATKDAGMDAHLSKPINIAEVIKTTAHFVTQK